MSLSAGDVARKRGRGVEALTRRDVALALLEVPAEQALESLPDLRRELTRASNAFSPPFWESCERTLGRIAAREATHGDVDAWLESTGTHPTRMIGMLVWEDEGERRPLAEEVHAQLVAHLEEAVAAGRIDPDRLAAGDSDEQAAYVALQEEWLLAEDAATTAPAWRVLDEEDEEVLAAWEEADRAARAELDRVLAEVGDRPCPTDELAVAVARLRAELADDHGFGGLLAASAWHAACAGSVGAVVAVRLQSCAVISRPTQARLMERYRPAPLADP